MRFSFLGPFGSYSHQAAQIIASPIRETEAIENLLCSSIRDVFEMVADGKSDFGIVPVENSSEGAVGVTLDSLLAFDVPVTRQLTIDVHHSLISHAASPAEILAVHSHPQALAQCRDWLRAHLPHAQRIDAPSTARAVELARDERTIAAIASSFAAKIHGVPVMAEGIEDLSDNATRFFVLGGQKESSTGADTTTLAFSTRHEKGALRHALEIFDRNDVNLSRIESRPSRQRRWEYIFFVDIAGHEADTEVARAIEELRTRCSLVRVFGSYPAER